jgi:hypothetical protein
MRARSVAITQAAERSLVQYSSDPQYLRYLTIVFTLTHNIVTHNIGTGFGTEDSARPPRNLTFDAKGNDKWAAPTSEG